jgi:hypothetical protein
MYKKQFMIILIGLFLTAMTASQCFAQSSGRQPSDAPEPVKVKTSVVLDPDALAKAEERAETLRVKLFDVQMREMDLQAAIEDMDYRLTPEGIDRALAFVGSVNSMDELRNALRTRLESEKARLNRRLELLTENRERLEAAITRADEQVERLRQRLSAL